MELTPDRPLPDVITDCREVLNSLGVTFSFQDHSKDPRREFRLNETSFLSSGLNYLGFRFVGKHSPLNRSGDMKTLEDLAEASTGIPKWGVLRADVDHLGQVFRVGLAGDDRSISRLSMLSHLISLYFSAHIQVLVHREPFHEGVSLVYSGGDDLFALGAWSMLPDLARRIANDFSRFTGDGHFIFRPVCSWPPRQGTRSIRLPTPPGKRRIMPRMPGATVFRYSRRRYPGSNSRSWRPSRIYWSN